MWLPFVLAAAFFWALAQAIDSFIVRTYISSPPVVMWYTEWWVFLVLLASFAFVDIPWQWLPVVIVSSAMHYSADFGYYSLINKIDISLANASWALLSLYLSIVGFLFFDEFWIPIETLGAMVTISGVLLLSLWGASKSIWKSFGIFAAVGLFYVPTWSIIKYILDTGVSSVGLLWLTMLCHASFAVSVPLCVPALRKKVRKASQVVDKRFCIAAFILILIWFIASVLSYEAFNRGPLSLVTIANNVQPFFSLFIAGTLLQFAPSLAPREVLTKQKLQVKIMAFCIVFIGLGLLALGQ